MIKNITKNLTNIQKSFCAGQLSPDELKASVKELNNDKSPGTDGLPAEFYKTFWDVIGQDLTEVFNSCYKSQLPPASQLEAVIRCIPKNGDKISNWHTVS